MTLKTSYALQLSKNVVNVQLRDNYIHNTCFFKWGPNIMWKSSQLKKKEANYVSLSSLYFTSENTLK